METNELCKIAYEFLKNDELIGLFEIRDDGDNLICFGGNPNEAFYGVRTVLVNKTTGQCDWYFVPDDMKFLDELPELDIPKEYLYK